MYHHSEIILFISLFHTIYLALLVPYTYYYIWPSEWPSVGNNIIRRNLGFNKFNDLPKIVQLSGRKVGACLGLSFPNHLQSPSFTHYTTPPPTQLCWWDRKPTEIHPERHLPSVMASDSNAAMKISSHDNLPELQCPYYWAYQHTICWSYRGTVDKGKHFSGG